MKQEHEHGCERVSTHELLLFAYGELDEASTADHVRSCPACQAYLAMVAGVRSAAQAARVKPPELRPAKVVKAAGARRINRSWSRPAAWAPLLAAAGLILMVGVWLLKLSPEPDREAQLTSLSPEPVPEYLTGVSELLIESELLADEGLEGLVVNSGSSGQDLNGEWSAAGDEAGLAMLDLESGLGLLSQDDETRGMEFEDPDLDWLYEVTAEMDSVY